MSVTAAQLYRERRIGERQSGIRRPALVVVDFTYGFTDRDSALGCDAGEAVRETARLLDVARELELPRVFTRIQYTAADERVAAPFLEKMPALAQCRAGSRWAEIDERLAPRPDEPVLAKLFASGFFGTNLAAFLAGEGCDGVVVTGATTSGCVRATVVDALQHGYRAVVPERAVADRAAEPHAAALFDIEAKYGQVVTAAEAGRILRASERKAGE
ncbi:isochorismatase family protein [Amycolatopsis silviterrae]|uniref:Isochorismatase family protein n=1 Tax=Amycolatopsis silviterrae TaxID=1656914 RepID=A0ABW5HIQ9_9PSEU